MRIITFINSAYLQIIPRLHLTHYLTNNYSLAQRGHVLTNATKFTQIILLTLVAVYFVLAPVNALEHLKYEQHEQHYCSVCLQVDKNKPLLPSLVIAPALRAMTIKAPFYLVLYVNRYTHAWAQARASPSLF